MTHNLKIAPTMFRAVSAGRKSFEVRKNDRNFQIGDVLHLVCTEQPATRPGQPPAAELAVDREVIYMLAGEEYGIKADHVVMALRPWQPAHYKLTCAGCEKDIVLGSKSEPCPNCGALIEIARN